jgi:hypothetical protein
VSFPATAKLTAIGNAKHVDGYVEKTGTGSFLYPVGHKGIYRPFGADGDAVTGAYFQENPGTATLPAGGPFSTANKEGTIKAVSSTEFWDIDGANASRITLTWNAASNAGTLTGNNLQLLGIAGWNSATSRWERIRAVPAALLPAPLLPCRRLYRAITAFTPSPRSIPLHYPPTTWAISNPWPVLPSAAGFGIKTIRIWHSPWS